MGDRTDCSADTSGPTSPHASGWQLALRASAARGQRPSCVLGESSCSSCVVKPPQAMIALVAESIVHSDHTVCRVAKGTIQKRRIHVITHPALPPPLFASHTDGTMPLQHMRGVPSDAGRTLGSRGLGVEAGNAHMGSLAARSSTQATRSFSVSAVVGRLSHMSYIM